MTGVISLGLGLLAAIADDDRCPLVSGNLLRLHAKVRGHIVVRGTGVRGATAAATEVLRVVQLLQGVAAQGEGCVFVVGVGGAECRGRGR